MHLSDQDAIALTSPVLANLGEYRSVAASVVSFGRLAMSSVANVHESMHEGVDLVESVEAEIA